MELFSKKLNKNIELEIAGGADEILLIDSKSLWSFMDNDNDVRAKGFSIEIDYPNARVSPDLSNVIIFGYAQDNDHRYSLECGESRKSSLTDDISRAYPAKMALKRLKDVCAINWLELIGTDGKRIYSSDEIPELVNEKNEIPETTVSELAEIVNASEVPENTETCDDPDLTSVEKELAQLRALFDSNTETSEEAATEDNSADNAQEGTGVDEEIEKLLKQEFKFKDKTYLYGDFVNNPEHETLRKWLLNVDFKFGPYLTIKNNLIKILKSKGKEV